MFNLELFAKTDTLSAKRQSIYKKYKKVGGCERVPLVRQPGLLISAVESNAEWANARTCTHVSTASAFYFKQGWMEAREQKDWEW